MRLDYDAVISVPLGAALVVAFSILGQGAWVDARTFGDRPLDTDLAGAVAASQTGRQWVSIHDAPWRCAEQRRVGHSYFPASADGIEVVARYDHDVDCAQATLTALTGVIEPLSHSDRERVSGAGLVLPDHAPVRFLDVCHDCGQDNARLGVIVCGALVLLGLFLYPLVVGARRLAGRWNAVVQGALNAPPAAEAQAKKKLRLIGLGLAVVGGACYRIGVQVGLSEGNALRGAGGLAMILGAVYLIMPGKMRALANRDRVR